MEAVTQRNEELLHVVYDREAKLRAATAAAEDAAVRSEAEAAEHAATIQRLEAATHDLSRASEDVARLADTVASHERALDDHRETIRRQSATIDILSQRPLNRAFSSLRRRINRSN